MAAVDVRLGVAPAVEATAARLSLEKYASSAVRRAQAVDERLGASARLASADQSLLGGAGAAAVAQGFELWQQLRGKYQEYRKAASAGDDVPSVLAPAADDAATGPAQQE